MHNERYGITTQSRRRTQLIGIVSALIGGIVLLLWVVWAGFDGSRPSIEARDMGYTIVDEYRVEVQFNLTVDRGLKTSCAVQAQNEKHAIVGWRVLDIEPSTDRTRAITVTINTSEKAVTGLVYQCWLT